MTLKNFLAITFWKGQFIIKIIDFNTDEVLGQFNSKREIDQKITDRQINYFVIYDNELLITLL